MTVLEASNRLIEWYRKDDCFNLIEHFKAIEPISEFIDHDQAAVQAALEELEKAGILKSTLIKKTQFWVLVRPICQLSQTITLKPETCNSISTIVNSYCQNIGDKMAQCDSKNLTDMDINNCLAILSKMLELNNSIRDEKIKSKNN